MSEWMTMDTAPKNGDFVLLKETEHDAGIGTVAAWPGLGGASNNWLTYVPDGSLRVIKDPVAWRPFPTFRPSSPPESVDE